MKTAEELLQESWSNGVSTKSVQEIELERSEALAVALDRVETLRTALEQQDPGMGTFLSQINQQLRKFPELVHILSDEDIAVVVQAHCHKKFDYLTKKESKPVRGKKVASLDSGGIVADLL